MLRGLVFVSMVVLGIAIYALGASASSAQLADFDPSVITDWIYDNIIVKIENFLTWLYDNIMGVLQIPFNILTSVFNAIGSAITGVFQTISDAVNNALYEFFWR